MALRNNKDKTICSININNSLILAIYSVHVHQNRETGNS